MAKVYIAGKISGDPLAKVKFEETACRYRKDGDIVLNPAELPEGMERADYMEICFAMINAADVVEVRHGKWETKIDNPIYRTKKKYCSCCGNPPHYHHHFGEYILSDYEVMSREGEDIE